MAMRLQELHPALVHFPIALLPLAVGADLLGRATGNEALLRTGQRVMPLAAGAAAIAAVLGLVAQQEVNAEGEAHDLLVTHRTLNLGLLGVAAAMAWWRSSHDRPSAAYLALGLAGLGVMNYSAYLGGHMVYEHGVGVTAAGGVRDGGAPELSAGRAPEVARTALSDLREGAAHAVEHLRKGDLVPALTGRAEAGHGGAPASRRDDGDQ